MLKYIHKQIKSICNRTNTIEIEMIGITDTLIFLRNYKFACWENIELIT